MYVELPAFFPPRGPRFRLLEPDVPASEEVVKPGFNAQHSSVEALFFAPRTVTFKVLAVARVEVRMGRMVARRILLLFEQEVVSVQEMDFQEYIYHFRGTESLLNLCGSPIC